MWVALSIRSAIAAASWVARTGRTGAAYCALVQVVNALVSQRRATEFADRAQARQTGYVDFEGASEELYRLVPKQFTLARDAKVSEARKKGDSELAFSLKRLRKPSVGAWLANLLVHERTADVQRLIDLGVELRSPKRKLGREDIRRVSKEKSDAVSKLARDAISMASRMGQPVSAAALEELETTLEAAFADEQAAESLLGGQLRSGLRYSGLGFGATSRAEPTSRTTVARSAPRDDRVAAQRELQKANREVEKADAEVVRVRRAIQVAEGDLKRLRSDEALAERRSSEARKRAGLPPPR